ncbi:MAG: hypothetical protein WCW61_03310 [Patescibacteria group bacterium]|jgi:hypothetical protein
MKKQYVVLFFVAIMALMFSTPTLAKDSQDSISTKKAKAINEIGTYACSGYFADQGGDGYFTYSELSLRSVKKNHLFGGFTGVSNVGCNFNDYLYRGLELFLGVTYSSWGKINENYSYALCASPSFKRFADYGRDDANTGDKVWQKDIGNQFNFWINISDKLNRPFHNGKLTAQFQTAFWSKREGTNISEGYVADRVNFKAVNRTYFKTQFESAIHKISIGKIGKIEPKLVFSFLRDWGSKKSMFETGTGIGISFNKGQRYYEILNIQYRARYGKEFSNKKRLDLIELGTDPKNLYKFLFQKN